MINVPYQMGRIAFLAGQKYDPAGDEFFMTYMTEHVNAEPADKERLYAKAEVDWRTGWMETKKNLQ